MKIRDTSGTSEDKIELQMTPMIDIVFQLLVFFIMTFKITAQEGDFNIKMPLAQPAEGLPDPDAIPPIELAMRAGGEGDLASMSMNNVSVQGFDDLRSRIISVVGDDTGASDDAKVRIAADEALRYEYVIEAITAVSGYRTDEGNLVKLVENIEFAPPGSGPTGE